MSKKSTIAVPRFELPDGTTSMHISDDIEVARSTEPGRPVQIIGGDTDLTAIQALCLAAYLAAYAEDAEEAQEAEVDELALVMRRFRDSQNATLADSTCRAYARAAIDAGWRKS
jgi:hypothetical protein